MATQVPTLNTTIPPVIVKISLLCLRQISHTNRTCSSSNSLFMVSKWKEPQDLNTLYPSLPLGDIIYRSLPSHFLILLPQSLWHIFPSILPLSTCGFLKRSKYPPIKHKNKERRDRPKKRTKKLFPQPNPPYILYTVKTNKLNLTNPPRNNNLFP